MKTHRRFTAAVLALLLVAGGMAAHGAPAQLGVTVGLTPAVQQVAPGAIFDLYVEATQAGDPFNGFDAVVGYDPTALTLVPGSKADQEGAYMAGACGNTFYDFVQHATSVTCTDVLLCNGVALLGPGKLFHLRFQASLSPQVTGVTFLAGTQFYDAGVYVRPVYTSDAQIGIGMSVGVGPSGPVKLTLAAAPNPSPAGLTFTIGADRIGPQTLRIFDLQGRTVRRFADTVSTAGSRTIHWDGRSDAGVALAPGVYLARLEVAGRAVWNRVTLIR